jgi:hypothetical protein
MMEHQVRVKPPEGVPSSQHLTERRRDLIMKAYNAMRTLRLILANHPNVRGYKVPDWLQTGKIWTY